jgi:hypothetical protein
MSMAERERCAGHPAHHVPSKSTRAVSACRCRERNTPARAVCGLHVPPNPRPLGVNVDVVLDAVTHVLVFVCVSARVTPFSTRGTSFELRASEASLVACACPRWGTTSGDESEARTGGKLPWSTQLRSGLGARAEGEERVLGRRGEVGRVRGRRVSPEASVELGATGAR